MNFKPSVCCLFYESVNLLIVVHVHVVDDSAKRDIVTWASSFRILLLLKFLNYIVHIIPFVFRHVSFVDCPGHDILMATMLNGAAVMDAALLLIGWYSKEICFFVTLIDLLTLE